MGNKMNKVLPGLYIGSARDAHDLEDLRENKISHILSIHDNPKPDLPDKEYLCLAVTDSPTQNILCYFPSANFFIHKARRTGNVLVHCQMGVSRSAAIIVAYLMTVTRLGWKDAMAALKAVRPFISPNLGFQKQLMIYDQKHVEEERTRLKTQFPLSQFNDVFHCEQLLEIYRLSRLRNERAMDIDVYPLALDAYGPKDFESLRREAAPVAGVVFCGPVTNANSEDDCLAQRLDRIHLTETFKSADTFSCGKRPTSKFVMITKSPEVNTPCMSSLNDAQENGGSVATDDPSGNALLSGLLNSAVMRESEPHDSKSSNDPTLDMLFGKSVGVSENSAKNGAFLSSSLKDTAMRESLPLHPESSNDAALEMLFRKSASVPESYDKNETLGSSSLNSTAIRESKPRDSKTSNDATFKMQLRNAIEFLENSDKNDTLRSGSSNGAAMRESIPHDPESSNDAIVDMLFRKSVEVSENSAKNGARISNPLNSTAMRESVPLDPEFSTDTALEVLFRKSVGISESSGKNGALLNSAAKRESIGHYPKSSNDATLVQNSVDVSKISTKNDARKSMKQDTRQRLAKSPDDVSVDSIFSSSVGSSRSSASKPSAEVKEQLPEDHIPKQLSDKMLREIGRAYLQRHVNVWHNMSDMDDDVDDDNKLLSAIREMNYSPSQSKINSNAPIELIKVTSNGPTENEMMSSIEMIKITYDNSTTSNDRSKAKLTSTHATQPGQTKIPSSDPTQKRLSGNSEEVITVLPSKSQLDQLFQA